VHFTEAVILVGILIGWIMIAVLGLRLSGRIVLARTRIEQAQVKIERLKEVIAETDGQTDALRQEAQTIEEQLTTFETGIEELRNRLHLAQLERNSHLIVATDRWARGDKCYVATVTNPTRADDRPDHPAARGWRLGRRYILWAPSANAAAEGFARRFPQVRGWVVAEPAEIDVVGTSVT